MKSRNIVILVALVAVIGAACTLTASADHSWGEYHWARSANPLSLKLGDNVTSIWDSYLRTASSDWSQSSVIDTNVVSGATNPKNCKAVSGRIEVCNSKYGNNGWLGIASIWVNGGHITQGAVKLNDTYFNTATYNTPAWRNLVMCQEIAHAFGLDHQDEDFKNANLGSCMDYTNDPSTNQHPNAHDFEQLELIYAHLDSSWATPSSKPSSHGLDIDTGNRSQWGKAIRTTEDKPSLYMRDLGNGEKLFTFVSWAR